MRIVVFSDSHRNLPILEKIILAQPQSDVFIHLGDGCQEFEILKEKNPGLAMYNVCGNCDWGSDAKTVDMLTLNSKKIIFAHGHTFGVKTGVGEFVNYAQNLNADIALYGHTHVASSTYLEGLYLMNPGSVTLPNQGPPSYGLIDITDQGIVTNIVKLERRRFRR